MATLRLGQHLLHRFPRLRVVNRKTSVYTSSGGVNEKPVQTRFGVPKALIVVLPFIYFGATISKNGAAFLEENEIFVPEDE